MPDPRMSLKAALHGRVVRETDLESLARLNPEIAREQITAMVRDLLFKESTPLAHSEREALVRDILDEVFGLGPLEPLLDDPTVSDVLVNGCDSVYVERHGMLERTDVRFDDNAHLMRVIERIVSRVGRRVDESSPMVDARLPDGSRVNAIIPPLALDGPALSIRRFGARPADRRRSAAQRHADEGDARAAAGCGQGQAQHPDLRRHGRRQDDPAQRALGVHPRVRAHRHDRGRGRAAAQAGARGPARDAAAERRGQGRGAPAPAA